MSTIFYAVQKLANCLSLGILTVQAVMEGVIKEVLKLHNVRQILSSPKARLL